MKKKGYTLAEMLVAMGVIGVVAALMLPLMNKYKPDAEKALFVRTYDAIAEATSVLVSNDELYPHELILNEPEGCDENDQCNYWDLSRAPLANYKQVTLSDGTVIGYAEGSSQVKKFCDAMAYQMHTAISFCGPSNGRITLVNNVMIDFMQPPKQPFFVTQVRLSPETTPYLLYIFMNGQIIPDYNGLNCFKTTAYLMTRSNWKKMDYKKIAKEVIEEEKKNKDNFDYWRAQFKEKGIVTKHHSDGTIIDRKMFE